MTSLIEQIKADREAGTPGPWVATVNHVMGYDRMVAHHKVDSHANGADKWIGVHIQPVFAVEDHGKANARRIARVPDMEAALLAAEKVVDAILNSDPWEEIDAAITDYRKATGAAE